MYTFSNVFCILFLGVLLQILRSEYRVTATGQTNIAPSVSKWEIQIFISVMPWTNGKMTNNEFGKI